MTASSRRRQHARVIRTRKPRQLLLAFFGEYVFDRYSSRCAPACCSSVLEGAGVAASAVRTNLDRMVTAGCSSGERLGREIGFELTSDGNEVLRDAPDVSTGGLVRAAG